MKCKFSKFNYVEKLEDGSLLVFNTSSKNKVIITDNSAIFAFMKNDPSFLSLEQFNYLENKKFIVPLDWKEQQIVKTEFNRWVYSEDVLHLTIIPTDACNFRCVYCYETEETHFMNQETADSIIKYILRNIRRYKVVSIGWFGGEPLLASDIVLYFMSELSTICKRESVLLTSNMTTNGYLLTGEMFKQLCSFGVRFFQITIDGTEALHNRQRPHKTNSDSFSRIVSNLLAIKHMFPTMRYEIGIRINISQEMQPYRDDILDWFESTFNRHKSFTLIFEWIRDWGGNVRKDLLTTANVCSSWIQEANRRNIKCADMLSNNCGLEFCEACKYNSFLVNYNGSLSKCTIALYDDKFKDLNEVGFIDPKGKAYLDKSKVAQWIGLGDEREACNQCVEYPLCMGVNCPFATRIRNEEQCLPIKELIPFYLRNMAQISNWPKI